MSAWILTAEQEPPPNVPVWIFWSENGRKYIWTGARTEKGWMCLGDNYWFDGEKWQTSEIWEEWDAVPLCWMPFPELPNFAEAQQ